MKLKKRDLLAPVKSDLPLTFSNERISAHGGLELFRRYFQGTGLPTRLREAFRGLALGGDYGPVRMVLCMIGVEGAARGFNPHHPKDKSYHPLTAHLAQTGQILACGIGPETEYSAMVTNKDLGIPALWHFMAGRGGHEKTLGELKQHLAFEAIPTQDRVANAVWQQISMLTHNLVRAFQLCVGVPQRPNTRKRTCLYSFASLQTFRFTLIDQPVRIVHPAGRPEIRFAVSHKTRRRIEHAEKRIARAA